MIIVLLVFLIMAAVVAGVLYYFWDDLFSEDEDGNGNGDGNGDGNGNGNGEEESTDKRTLSISSISGKPLEILKKRFTSQDISDVLNDASVNGAPSYDECLSHLTMDTNKCRWNDNEFFQWYWSDIGMGKEIPIGCALLTKNWEVTYSYLDDNDVPHEKVETISNEHDTVFIENVDRDKMSQKTIKIKPILNSGEPVTQTLYYSIPEDPAECSGVEKDLVRDHDEVDSTLIIFSIYF